MRIRPGGVLLLIPLCLASCQTRQKTASSQLVAFPQGDKWGYKNAEGKTVIPARFDIAQEFSPEGLAAVVDDAGWAYIDRQGTVRVRPFPVDNGPDYFREGLARFTRDGKIGFFDRTGKTVIEPRFDFALPFSEGLAAVCEGCREVVEGEHRAMRGGKWGFINRAGELAIPLKFEDARSFEGGVAQVLAGGAWRAINAKGELTPRGR